MSTKQSLRTRLASGGKNDGACSPIPFPAIVPPPIAKLEPEATMNPIFLELGDLTIHWYGVFMALAFSAALINWIVIGRRRGWPLQDCSDLLFWVMIGGILGARINYVLADLETYSKDPLSALRIYEGGLIYYGGFVGAALSVLLLAKRRGIPLIAMLDFVVISVPLGHALGRIGCFMNGCCFGRPFQGKLGCTFPRGSAVWQQQHQDKLVEFHQTHSLPVHPVQLYETVANLGVYGLLVFLYLRSRNVGLVAGVYLVSYPLSRFLLENFRGTQRLILGPHSTAQWVSLGLMACGVALIVYALKWKRTYNGPAATATAAAEN
jgi:phosphatidylglycerol:prolipoprotein diacylglycerol transferase